jgi:hypothetical protein
LPSLSVTHGVLEQLRFSVRAIRARAHFRQSNAKLDSRSNTLRLLAGFPPPSKRSMPFSIIC